MKDITEKIAEEIKNLFEGAEGGHDWWHTRCVRNLAKHIAEKEGADIFVTELAALLHDISDFKFNGGNEYAGGIAAEELLRKYDIPDDVINKVVYIVNNISFKGAGEKDELETLEAKCVQDADRLDAIGARGIGRTFSYGGFSGAPMYDPEIKPRLNSMKDEYRKGRGTTINHFYEKLLLLKDRMKTETGRQIAAERHEFMEQFLKQFFSEWDFKA